MASSQPISLPSASTNPHNNNTPVDYTMGSGSYNSQAGSFNPASYTKHFMGSPVSWRSGSVGFGGRSFTTGSPMDCFLGSIDCKPASLESDRDAIAMARQRLEREDELCRNYACCGIQLNDLHALIEHFEEVHVIVVNDQHGQQYTQMQLPFNPQPIPNGIPSQPVHHQQTGVSSQLQEQLYRFASQAQSIPTQTAYPIPFDPDDMELEMDVSQSFPQPQGVPSSRSSPSSGAPTPPDTPVSTPQSTYPSPTGTGPKPFGSHLPQLQTQPAHGSLSPYHSPYTSQPPSPHAYTAMASGAIAAFDSAGSRRSSGHTPSALNVSTQPPADGAEGGPSRPSLNLNLTSFSRAASSSPSHQAHVEPFTAYSQYATNYPAGEGDASVPPALLFSNAGTPDDTPAHSRVPSPTPGHSQSTAPSPTASSAPKNTLSAPGTPSTASPGEGQPKKSIPRAIGAPLLLSSKPFKCPKPGCNKSYKQANGLKYHMTHGSCNFNPPKDLEHVQALLEKKRRERGESEGLADLDFSSGVSSPSQLYADLSQITDAELREVEREAEKRYKPFACGVGDCQRRYKNMNGLRYHYQHSGEHGVIGLGLLATGVHECLSNGVREHTTREGRKSRGHSKPSSRAPSTSRTSTPASPVVTIAPILPQPEQSSQPQARVIQQTTTPSFSLSSSSLAQALGQFPTPGTKPATNSPAPTTPQYQQQFLEQQRAQYTQQQHQQAQQLQLDAPQADLQQQQQLQQLQAQFAAMQNRMYNTSLDATMAG